MKKKILIVSPHMILGGLEKSLLSLLNVLPSDKFEITVMLVKKRGALLSQIPKEVEVLEIPISNDVSDELLAGGAKAIVLHSLKKLNFARAINISIKKFFKLDPVPELKIKYCDIPDFEGKFDVAIAYQMHMPFIVKYVSKNIKAKKKILWIHSDMSKSGFDPHILEDELKAYDEFITVSKELKKEFVEHFPIYLNKTDVVYNITPSKTILEMAEENVSFDDNHNGIKILTIGRLAKEKGIDIAIEAFKRIEKNYSNCKWYIIGEGCKRVSIEKKIKDNNLEDKFILLGAKANPYPYLKECDIYVQPSRSEGYCITLSEAKILNRPIVTTNFAGAYEQIETNRNGLITEVNAVKLSEAIIKLIENPKLRDEFSVELKNNKKSNVNSDIDRIIEKLDV